MVRTHSSPQHDPLSARIKSNTTLPFEGNLMFDSAKRWLMVITTAAAFVVAGPVRADDPKSEVKPDAPKTTPPKPKESATEPKPKDANWVKRHEGFLAEGENLKGKIDLLFVGDSITDGWRSGGKK